MEKTNCGIGFSVCGDVIVLHVAVSYRNTQLSLSCSYITLHTDGHTLTAENQFYEEFFGSVLPAGALSLCLCSSGKFIRFAALSWQSCDCRSDLPVTVSQEATALGYNVKGWILCTLELGGRVICSLHNL